MRIGFDGQYAFHNNTGLGHYSRTLVRSIARYFPDNELYLFNTSPASNFHFDEKNVHEVLPSRLIDRIRINSWHRRNMVHDIKKCRLDLFHGLTDEIPIGVRNTAIPVIASIHDLVPEKFPQWFSRSEGNAYRKKLMYAAQHADHIIAISEQTKKDLIEIYEVPETKMSICYQSCNPSFGRYIPDEQLRTIKKKYGLPAEFILSVGSVIERKNLLGLCKALFLLRNDLRIPLVVIGNGKEYMKVVKDYINQNGLSDRVLFLSETPLGNQPGLSAALDLPAIYQLATALVYPSFFEGFGIPVLEAMWSRLPVITANTSSIPEVGGDAVIYFDPHHADEIAEGIRKVIADESLRATMKEKGYQRAQIFSTEATSAKVMMCYNSIKKMTT